MSIPQAVILRHPHCPEPILEAPVMEAPPPTRESILAAWRESNEVRAALGIPLHPLPIQIVTLILRDHEEMRRNDAKDALTLLIEEHGLPRVRRWVRNIAHLKGESV